MLSRAPSGRALSRRAIALILALIIHALIVLVLLTLAPPISKLVEPPRKVVAFQMLPEPAPVPTPAPRARAQAKPAPPGGSAPKRVAPPARAEKVADTPPTSLNMIVLDKQSFNAGDIATLPKSGGAQVAGGGGDGGTGSGSGKGSSDGNGDGPGGEHLYGAEWFRKPTNAELSTYLPRGNPGPGKGMVACQMLANYRVENCRELGESPRGSGYARTVRQAAWQFRVIPTRLGDRPVVGAWVRITITWGDAGVN